MHSLSDDYFPACLKVFTFVLFLNGIHDSCNGQTLQWSNSADARPSKMKGRSSARFKNSSPNGSQNPTLTEAEVGQRAAFGRAADDHVVAKGESEEVGGFF